ncbi:MAG: diadenylate cyclase CdaA [Clostridiaceae bacterium]|nr:diadenylate cyclase CdaA [Clostridiaceae bacterium]
MNIFTYFGQYIKLATVWDVVDILIVAAFLYKIIRLIRNTAAARLLKGIFVILIIMQLSDLLKLHVVNFIMVSSMQLGTIALVVVFQPELRRILEQFGKTNLHLFHNRNVDEEATQLMVMQTIEAVSAMAWSKTGALIVFETEDSLSHISATGTTVNADVTAELVKNIFYPKAPLHDGAVVISNLRLQAAGCILPLTAKFDLSKELGTRHRAALGVTENSDCCCVVVSEETGAISFAKSGMLKRHLAPETLERLLLQELMPPKEEPAKNFLLWIKGVLKK